MRPTSTDPRILGYLGRALSLEFSAVQLYSTQARLVATWGLDEPARRLRHEADEEMQHVDRVIARMLALDVLPNASQLRPVGVSRNLQELLMFDQNFEHQLVKLYDEAVHYAVRIGSLDDRLFFQQLLEEEQAHARELETWIGELEPTAGQRRGGQKRA